MAKPDQAHAASTRLRALADDYDANLVTYGQVVALDILVSELSEALDDIASVAAEVRDA